MTLEEIAERLKKVSDTPLLDARLLMAHAQGNLEALIERRLNHEPISKIIGKRGFWKSDFITSPDVLDPRPDTEILIETVLAAYPDQKQKYQILDIGVGSGCVLYSLLDEYPNAEGIGVDKSAAALKVAEANKGNRSGRLFQKDFMQPDWEKGLGQFDIIVSNPPYIPTADIKSLSTEVQAYDPLVALDGGADGLEAYRALAGGISSLLKPQGIVFFEIGIGQARDVIRLFEEKGWSHKETRRDYGGIERVVSFQYLKK